MICVTGSARTGTSMMMQTLVNLGYKTPAPKFFSKDKWLRSKNSKGFYELTTEVENGVKHHNYKGQAIKLFPGCLWETPKEYVDKLIICYRNPTDATKSYTPIHKYLKEPYTPLQIYNANYSLIEEYIDGVNHIFINFDVMITNPKIEIDRLVEFLGIHPSEEVIEKTIKNINVCHY